MTVGSGRAAPGLGYGLCRPLDGRFGHPGDRRTVALCDGSSVTGPVTLVADAGGTDLSGTTVDGPLRCEDNTPAPDLRGLVVRGPRYGQCR
ncbi:hypothetical protein [Streptomyces sp. NPDC015130]|uniref:hypothetical protein n=1 Tax=Streptomyces sp. NPDC015130 TaxID=3364940 RepID=UPI0036F90F8D